SVRHIFKTISYLEIQLLSGVSGGYISLIEIASHDFTQMENQLTGFRKKGMLTLYILQYITSQTNGFVE
ncbi:hypothetical protein RZP54_30405, partial [Raoultella ornithinolytica]|uniref:hypothetical protein n=1 Tax=Raoultella ornithinolytica TaxID=54291 RepID=UPI00292B5108